MNTYQYTAETAADTLKSFDVKISQGLSKRQAKNRLEQYGPNQVRSQTNNWWQILFRQFKSPFIYLLVLAAALAYFLGQKIEAEMIFIFLIINAFLGFNQEYRSEQTLKLLKQCVASFAKIRRDGKDEAIPLEQVVPGDLVILETGDKIPADLRLIETEGLTVDESVLTGESAPVKKTDTALTQPVKEPHQATNLGFAGTTVVCGRGLGIVLATGSKSMMGHLAHLTIDTHHISNFEKGINKFSKFILRLILITLTFIFLANLLIKGREADIFELLIFSIALAVSVIPEALPLVTTFSLSRGALKLAKHKMVVRRLSAIEDLGGIEILCTDKTGTLTENLLTVSEVYPLASDNILLHANLAAASLQHKKLEPFDIALWQALSAKEQAQVVKTPRIDDVPFNPANRINLVLVKHQKNYELIARGAAENIIELCSNLTPAKLKELKNWLKNKGASGLRVIAIAGKNYPPSELPDPKKLALTEEKHFNFLGLISFIDPIKKSVSGAVAKAKELGLTIKILTGDSPEVAGAVAKTIGLVDSPKQVITGQHWENLTGHKKQEALEKYQVFARVSPEQKFKIIEELQKRYEVGFLGEGINDAPALKIAGVSLVVQSAADIARDTADIILLNKNLEHIVEGIKQGREVFANTTKYIKATLASNFGNFYAVAIASLFIAFLPMLPLQILLLNLLSDFPMIAIATDNVDPNEINGPKKYNVKNIIVIAVILGLISTVFDFIFFALFFRYPPAVLQTNWFIGSVLTELVFLFCIRSKQPFYKAIKPSAILVWLTIIGFIATVTLPFTPLGQNLFSFSPPTKYHLILIFIIIGIYFFISEKVKNLYYRKFTNNELISK